jgi:pimeloyl-ACP methyl ester carboxylesterase
MRTYHVTVDGLVFDVSEDGPQSGPPVLLLHGFPQTRASFQAVARLLAQEGLRTIALDQRGYSPGARPTEVAAYSVEHLVGDVLGLLDQLDLPTAHLVGHDWGAIVAWAATAVRRERVRTLTAVSVPHPRAMADLLAEQSPAGDEQRQRSSYISLFQMDGGKAEDVLLANGARALHDMFSPLPEALILPHYGALSQRPALTAALNWYRAMDMKTTLNLPNVSTPTTFVWSTEDVAISRTVAERCGAYVSGDYRFVRLPGVSHWIPDQAPDDLARAVVGRVRSVEG